MAICQPLCQPVSIVRRKRIESPHVDCRFLGWSVSGRTGRFLYPDHFVFEGWSEVYRHFISLPLLAQRLLSAVFFFFFFESVHCRHNLRWREWNLLASCATREKECNKKWRYSSGGECCYVGDLLVLNLCVGVCWWGWGDVYIEREKRRQVIYFAADLYGVIKK